MTDEELVEGLADLEAELAEITANWTSPVVVRTYPTTEDGHEDYEDEVMLLADHGYAPAAQSIDGGHVHVGRLVLTAGFSILAGRAGIRSEGLLSVTFTKSNPGAGDLARPTGGAAERPNALDDLVILEKLGQLRDAGVISPEEFATKKADILSRL